MHTVPIDYDRPMYEKAREKAGGTDERLFEDYFDAQLDMLEQLKPPVVGHFDLIRLKSDDMECSFTTWPGVWSKILRNLDFIASYGGMLELNSAALRKGMTEPYPKAEICKVRTQSFVIYLTTKLTVLGICGAQRSLLFV
jgi:Histidinol phosphatase and related hydrolases of the PHP family